MLSYDEQLQLKKLFEDWVENLKSQGINKKYMDGEDKIRLFLIYLDEWINCVDYQKVTNWLQNSNREITDQ